MRNNAVLWLRRTQSLFYLSPKRVPPLVGLWMSFCNGFPSPRVSSTSLPSFFLFTKNLGHTRTFLLDYTFSLITACFRSPHFSANTFIVRPTTVFLQPCVTVLFFFAFWSTLARSFKKSTFWCFATHCPLSYFALLSGDTFCPGSVPFPVHFASTVPHPCRFEKSMARRPNSFHFAIGLEFANAFSLLFSRSFCPSFARPN